MNDSEALHFVKQLRVYCTDIGKGIGYIGVNVRLDAFDAAIAALERLSKDRDAWRRRATELESIASDRL